ncbi:MAG: ABC transporter permease [Hyphomicrobiaceae bacterium]
MHSDISRGDTASPPMTRETVMAILAVQMRVIGALILRETRSRFGRSQLGYLWAIAEPLLYIISLSLLFDAISRHSPFGSSVALFFATGLLPYQLFSRIASALTTAFDANEALLAYPIVKPVDTLIARAMLEIATAALVMILLFGGLVYFADAPEPESLHVMVVAILGLSLFGFGVGTINAVIGTLFVSWRQVYDVASRPLIIVCGVFFTLDTLPAGARDIVAYIPITHGIELFRSGYYSGYRSTVMDIGYLFVSGLVLCLVGLAAERIIRLTRP